MMVSSNLLARGSSSFYSRMYSSLVENTIKTYQLAKEFNKTTSLMRLNFLENLESRSDGGLLDEKLRDSWARNIYGLARMIPDIEKKQRNRQTILRIPKFREMTAAQWQRARGPELVYWLAKSFGLLGPILPQDINVKYHVEINYGANLSAERGNFLVPSPKMMYPCIKVYSIRPDRLYSFIIVDADYPIIQINRRVQFCLWTK